jgi:Co/Zn/Cd efflux system component
MLIKTGREQRSVVLEADGRHLMTDVWTSVGVVVGVALSAITGWERLDAIIALLVAANIVVTGAGLVRRFTGGLMDRALPPEQRAAIDAALDRYAGDEVQFHALRTRSRGRARSSRSTFSCPATGRSRAATISSNASSTTARRARAGRDLHPPRTGRGPGLVRRHQARPPHRRHRPPGLSARLARPGCREQ